jgi:hypothetical protein
MNRTDKSLREQLLGLGVPAADRLETYRTGVEKMIEKKQKLLDRQRRISSSLWIFLVLLCTVFLVVGGYRGGEDRIYFGVLACFWFMFGAVFLFRYFLDRNQLEFLKEIKDLKVQILELTEKISDK